MNKTLAALGIVTVVALGVWTAFGLVETVEAGHVGILTRSGVAADSPVMPGIYRLGAR